MTNNHPQRNIPGLKTSILLLALLGAVNLAVANAQPKGVIDPDSMASLVRDLKLTPEQLQQRALAEQVAIRTEQTLRDSLGHAFGGSWLIPDEHSGMRLIVAATNVSGLNKVQSAGAIPKLVVNSLEQLAATREQLDHVSTTMEVPDSVASWSVDARTNSVVVEILVSDSAAAERALEFIAQSGADTRMIRFELVEARPQPTTDLQGGERYQNTSTGGSCSTGFSAEKWVIMPTEHHFRGFVTAGHCGDWGDGVSLQGSHFGGFVSSVFPGSDNAFVATTGGSNWTPRPWVNNYSGGHVSVHGEQEALVGSAVCRSGYATGYRCGNIVAKNVTVNYPQGTVYDLTQIDACAGFGDSGGAVLTPAGQAQGVTSGGQFPSGPPDNCSQSTPVTYIEPWNNIGGIIFLFVE